MLKQRLWIRIWTLLGFLLGALLDHLAGMGWVFGVLGYGMIVVGIFTVRDFYIQRV